MRSNATSMLAQGIRKGAGEKQGCHWEGRKKVNVLGQRQLESGTSTSAIPRMLSARFLQAEHECFALSSPPPPFASLVCTRSRVSNRK